MKMQERLFRKPIEMPTGEFTNRSTGRRKPVLYSSVVTASKSTEQAVRLTYHVSDYRHYRTVTDLYKKLDNYTREPYNEETKMIELNQLAEDETESIRLRAKQLVAIQEKGNSFYEGTN